MSDLNDFACSLSRIEFDISVPADSPLPADLHWGIALAGTVKKWVEHALFVNDEMVFVAERAFHAGLLLQSNKLTLGKDLKLRARCPTTFAPGEYTIFMFWNKSYSENGGGAYVCVCVCPFVCVSVRHCVRV